MHKNCIHDFHFVIDKAIKEKLNSLNFLNKSSSLSGKIVKILEALTPIIKKEHKWGEQRLSKYSAVCINPEDIREDIHIYIPEEFYRQLKLLHQDLNFYSIAQLVREFINFFLGLFDVYKDAVFQELEEIFSQWGADEKNDRLTTREIIRQLRTIIQFLPGKNRLVTIYDNNFSPFWILRI